MTEREKELVTLALLFVEDQGGHIVINDSIVVGRNALANKTYIKEI